METNSTSLNGIETLRRLTLLFMTVHRQSRFSRPDWLSASDGIWCRQVSHGRASLPAATQKLHRSAAKLTQCKRQCGSMVPPSRGIRNLCVSCLYRHTITSYIMHAIVLHVLACEHVVECYCKYILYHIVSYCHSILSHDFWTVCVIHKARLSWYTQYTWVQGGKRKLQHDECSHGKLYQKYIWGEAC